jgi:hypothetical protein
MTITIDEKIGCEGIFDVFASFAAHHEENHSSKDNEEDQKGGGAKDGDPCRLDMQEGRSPGRGTG